MSGTVEHTDIGAYALGLLEDADRLAFEEHLATCERCRAELDDMGDLRGLFGDIDADAFSPLRAAPFPDRRDGDAEDAETGPPAVASPGSAPTAPVIDLRSARSARVRRTVIALASAAAAAALFVAGVGLGGGFSSDDDSSAAAHSDHATPTSPSGHLLLTGERHPETGSVRGIGSVTGVVALEQKGWGTHIGLELSGVQGPLLCDLVAVGPDGRTEVIGNWQVPAKGYGVPSNPEPLTFHGGTSFAKDTIQRVDVRTSDGRTLVSVPV